MRNTDEVTPPVSGGSCAGIYFQSKSENIRLKDYYTILGLDADAQVDTIKVAYRRLAREAHPDRVGQDSPDAQAQASLKMAELNEAYSTLSDLLKRRGYDEDFKKFQARAAAGTIETAPEPVIPPEPEPEAPSVQRAQARPQSQQVISNVVSQFASQVHSRLIQNNPVFAWRGGRMEGFDWAMRSSFWLSEYHVALRGFATADPASTSKLINYATAAIERSQKIVKKNFYLLLMPFQRMRDPEQVLAACRRFAGNSGEGPLSRAKIQIVLMDVTHGRTVPCGPRIDDTRFGKLLQRLGLSN